MKVSLACFYTILIISGFTNAEKILQKKQWKRNLKGDSKYHGGEDSANTWGGQAGSTNAYGGQEGSPYNYGGQAGYPYNYGGQADSPYTYGEGSWYGNTDVTTGGWSGGKSGKGSTKGSSGKGGKYGGGGVIKAGSGNWGGYVQIGNLGVLKATNQAACLSYKAGGTAGLEACGSSPSNLLFVLEYSKMSSILGSFMIRHVASGMYLLAPTTCAEGDLVLFGFRGQPGTEFFNEGNGLSLTSVYCWETTSVSSIATGQRVLAVSWDNTAKTVEMVGFTLTDVKSTWMEVNPYFVAEL